MTIKGDRNNIELNYFQKNNSRLRCSIPTDKTKLRLFHYDYLLVNLFIA